MARNIWEFIFGTGPKLQGGNVILGQEAFKLAMPATIQLIGQATCYMLALLHAGMLQVRRLFTEVNLISCRQKTKVTAFSLA